MSGNNFQVNNFLKHNFKNLLNCWRVSKILCSLKRLTYFKLVWSCSRTSKLFSWYHPLFLQNYVRSCRPNQPSGIWLKFVQPMSINMVGFNTYLILYTYSDHLIFLNDHKKNRQSQNTMLFGWKYFVNINNLISHVLPCLGLNWKKEKKLEANKIIVFAQ